MNSQRLLRTVAFKRKSRHFTLFSIRAAVFLLSLSTTVKTLEQEPTFEGHDDPVESSLTNEHDVDQAENADEPGDAIASSSDAGGRQGALDLLRMLSTASEREFDGSRSSEEKRKWLNHGSLRIWGKRESREKSSQSRGDGQLVASSVDGDHMSNGHALVMTFKKQSDRYRQGQERKGNDGLGRKYRPGTLVFPFEEISSFNEADDEAQPLETYSRLGLTVMPGKPTGMEKKRKWERNSLRIWGKRNPGSGFAGNIKDLSTYPNMRRRKWENLPLRVWGK